jgi:hypothetical protein
MNHEKQCCRLHQAKILKELGVSQDTLMSFDIDDEGEVYFDTTKNNSKYSVHHPWDAYAAYTVAELSIMLPWECFNQSALDLKCQLDPKPYYGFWKIQDKWNFRFDNSQDNLIKFYDTQAECYASYLINLLETKTITPEEVNLRLNQ